MLNDNEVGETSNKNKESLDISVEKEKDTKMSRTGKVGKLYDSKETSNNELVIVCISEKEVSKEILDHQRLMAVEECKAGNKECEEMDVPTDSKPIRPTLDLVSKRKFKACMNLKSSSDDKKSEEMINHLISR